jgi:hypothetical protein
VTGSQAVLPSHISEDNTGAIFLMKNNGIGSRTKHVDIRMRLLNDMVDNGELEVDHCPGKFITLDEITKNTPEAVRKVHADTMYNGHILPPDYNRSKRQDVNIVLEVRDNKHSLMCPTQRLKMTKLESSNRYRGTDSCTMGTDRCPMISRCWYSVEEGKRSDQGWSSLV